MRIVHIFLPIHRLFLDPNLNSFQTYWKCYDFLNFFQINFGDVISYIINDNPLLEGIFEKLIDNS